MTVARLYRRLAALEQAFGLDGEGRSQSERLLAVIERLAPDEGVDGGDGADRGRCEDRVPASRRQLSEDAATTQEDDGTIE